MKNILSKFCLMCQHIGDHESMMPMLVGFDLLRIRDRSFSKHISLCIYDMSSCLYEHVDRFNSMSCFRDRFCICRQLYPMWSKKNLWHKQMEWILNSIEHCAMGNKWHRCSMSCMLKGSLISVDSASKAEIVTNNCDLEQHQSLILMSVRGILHWKIYSHENFFIKFKCLRPGF